jgi:lipopolysaccharide transport system permease protein
LIGRLAGRDVQARYRSSALGLLWALFLPLVMLAVYSFVFTIVFKARWDMATGAKGEFAIILFSGLILHQWFTDVLVRSPNLIVEQANFVKKIIFPLHILTPVHVVSTAVHFAISLAVMLAGAYFIYGSLPATLLYLPIILAPFVILMLGLSWFLAAIGVFVRDVAHIMGILSTVLLFFSTIFYPASRLPEKLQPLLYLNPLSFIVDSVRDVALWGKAPHWEGLGIYTLIAVAMYVIGLWVFNKTRKGFADVL